MSEFNNFDGILELRNELDKIIQKAEEPENIIEIGVKEFVKDLKKLPKPISKIKRSGYTHLIDTFSYRKRRKEFEAGWGKYYGPLVEGGTVKMGSRPHLKPCFERNKEKYYTKMLDKFYN